MDSLNTDVKIIEFKKFRHVTLSLFENQSTIGLISATSSYIPIEDFKEAFNAMEHIVIERKISKLIFDKRHMRVFDQPSMEWYFVDWKGKMAIHGLHKHVKILPEDKVFCQSVKLGRKQIDLRHPTAAFHKLNIRYADSIEEAVLED